MLKNEKISRRTLAKQVAGAAALLSVPLPMHAASSLALANEENHNYSGSSNIVPAGGTMPALRWREVYPGIWKATVGVPEAYTPVTSRAVAPASEPLAQLPKVSRVPLVGAQGKVTDRGCLLAFPLAPGEQVYGLGLQFLSFEQRGKRKVARVNADPKMDTGDSNAPVPFYVTTSGIGIFVDTARYADFYFGNEHPRPKKATVISGEQHNLGPAYNNQNGEQVASVEVEVPRCKGVDVYLFAGPTMLQAVQRYNLFSGGGVAPPEWGLGFWYRQSSYADQTHVKNMAQNFRSKKIPCDVMGLEPGWQSHAYACTFQWDEGRFPQHDAMLAQMKNMNYHMNLWEHAYTSTASPMFPALSDFAGNYGVFNGLVPDFAGERGREIFGDFHGKTLIDKGVSGFKLDECDNSDYTGGWSFPEMSRFPSGVDGEQMHSVFGLRYQQALWDQFKKRNQATLSLVRSSGALASPYPFVLYSDLYDHRQYVRAQVNSGFSGLLWCPEIRDAHSPEELYRRLQGGVFSALMMVNGWYIINPPWMQIESQKNNAGQFMSNWQEVESRCCEIIGWRMQLMPYLKAAYARYHTEGIPPFRALVLDYPDQQALASVDDQYLVGDRMVVAPLFAGEPNRTVILPNGEWQDFWTGKSVPGGQPFQVDGSFRNIPVYVRSGSVLPWAEVGQYAGDPNGRKITVRVYGDGHIPFELTAPYEPIKFEWNAQSSQGKASGSKQYSILKWQQMS